MKPYRSRNHAVLSSESRQAYFPDTYSNSVMEQLKQNLNTPLGRYILDLESYVSVTEQEKIENLFNGTTGKGGGK